MKKVFFKPWVGINYENKSGVFNKKILILGESLYCGDCGDCGDLKYKGTKCRQAVSDVIKEQIFETGKKRPIYTKLTNLLLDKDFVNLDDKKTFWNSVAFYNYVQESLDGPRKRPTQEMWTNSEEPFYEVMNELMPDYLLILGKALWDNLPGVTDIDWKRGPLLLESEESWYYPHKDKNKKTLALWIYHPSGSGFSYAYKPIIKEFLKSL